MAWIPEAHWEPMRLMDVAALADTSTSSMRSVSLEPGGFIAMSPGSRSAPGDAGPSGIRSTPEGSQHTLGSAVCPIIIWSTGIHCRCLLLCHARPVVHRSRTVTPVLQIKRGNKLQQASHLVGNSLRTRIGPMKEVKAVHVTTMAMVCFLLMLVPGCHESKGKERALAFAEQMLQAQKKRAIRDPLDKVWADQYQLPGIHRGLKALERARHGRWNVAVPMWSHLTVYRYPEGISGDLAVAAIHQPGHSDISGIYFITKDGKTYDCSAVNEYETEDHPGWEHYLYFLLAERAKPLNDNEQMYAVSAASRFAGPE